MTTSTPIFARHLALFALLGLLLLAAACGSAEPTPADSTTPTSTADVIDSAEVAITPSPTLVRYPTATPVISAQEAEELDTTETNGDAVDVSNFTCRMVSSIPETECEALLGIFYATRGESWGNRYPTLGDRWLSTDDPCGWHGVTCQNGHVFELDLRESQLRGALTSAVVGLGQLDTLTIYKNELIGSLPPELGDMDWLRSADLSNNQFNGSIPDSYGGLVSLEALNLNYNDLSGELPEGFENLPVNGSLGWLDVSFNPRLTGAIAQPLKDIFFFNSEGTGLRQ